MSKSIVISERDNIAAVVENGKVAEFFIHRGDMLLGDVYLAQVENILPSIDAAFVNLGGDKMGFLHASDVQGKGPLVERLKPKQQLLVQIMKEPTGHKGPRVSTAVSLPGRFLVFMPDEKGISVSRKIVSPKERSRLKSIVNLLKPAGVGVIIRTEAENQSEAEIQEDLEFLLEKWTNIVTAADTVTPPNLLYRDQDLLYRVIREACTDEVKEILVDTPFALHRTNQLLQSWNMGQGITVSVHKGNDSILVSKGIDREIRTALQTKVNMPSGGYLYIQTTEALSVIDVNSGKFTSSATQGETIRKTNLEAVHEIARQLRLRNIGGMIIIDFIDMDNRVDKLAVLEELEQALEPDKAKPQVGQLSDLGLVELTRHRQGQSLAEIFSKKCPACNGNGYVLEEFNFALPPQDGEIKSARITGKLKMPQKMGRPDQQQQQKQQAQQGQQSQQQQSQRQQQHQQRQQQHQQRQQQHQQQRAAAVQQEKPQQKKVNTFPSLVASMIQNAKKVEKGELSLEELSADTVKNVTGKNAFVPAMSTNVRIAAIPPVIARQHMDENYTPDVFTIIQELEASVEEAAPQQVQPTKPQRPVPQMQRREPVKAAQAAQPRRVAEQPAKVEKAPEPQEVVEQQKIVEPQKAIEPKVAEKVEAEEQQAVKEEAKAEKPATTAPKRGRRPKTESTTKRPAARRVTKKPPAEE